MDLSTTYLGMKLRTPMVPSASPLASDLGNIKRMEDAGASAIVLESLFEEQLKQERFELHHHLSAHTHSFPEALTFFPEPSDYKLGPEEYLKHIQKAKGAVKIPIIASLNGASLGGWTDFAKKMEQAGADAIELNIYFIPTDFHLTSTQVEQTYIDILKAVRSVVKIPVALKLGAFFTNTANIAKRLDEAGADALVLFNRFYQPDIDLEALEVKPSVIFSTPQARRLPMRWIAILYGRIKADLAATSGVHGAEDVLRMLMVGANVAMLCSALMRNGIDYLRTVEKELIRWMEEHEYESVQQMRGSMSQIHSGDPSAYERAQYIKTLQSFKPNPSVS